jgi:hypothetical protein
MNEYDWLIDAFNHLNLARHELMCNMPDDEAYQDIDRKMKLVMDKIDLVMAMLREKEQC